MTDSIAKIKELKEQLAATQAAGQRDATRRLAQIKNELLELEQEAMTIIEAFGCVFEIDLFNRNFCISQSTSDSWDSSNC